MFLLPDLLCLPHVSLNLPNKLWAFRPYLRVCFSEEPTDTHFYLNNFPLLDREKKHISPVRVTVDENQLKSAAYASALYFMDIDP